VKVASEPIGRKPETTEIDSYRIALPSLMQYEHIFIDFGNYPTGEPDPTPVPIAENVYKVAAISCFFQSFQNLTSRHRHPLYLVANGIPFQK
jgi:hypothetical protein